MIRSGSQSVAQWLNAQARMESTNEHAMCCVCLCLLFASSGDTAAGLAGRVEVAGARATMVSVCASTCLPVLFCAACFPMRVQTDCWCVPAGRNVPVRI